MIHGPNLCEYCGYGSLSKERCTHCGRDISDQFKNPPRFRIPLWGRLTIRLHDAADAEPFWKELAEAWDRWERETNLGLIPTQMEKFRTRASVLELYGSDSIGHDIEKRLHGRGIVEFEELPHEEIPHRPKYQLPRPPTVPRNKR